MQGGSVTSVRFSPPCIQQGLMSEPVAWCGPNACGDTSRWPGSFMTAGTGIPIHQSQVTCQSLCWGLLTNSVCSRGLAGWHCPPTGL